MLLSAVCAIPLLAGGRAFADPTHVCGNSTLDNGEVCDLPFDAACPGLCLPNCT